MSRFARVIFGLTFCQLFLFTAAISAHGQESTPAGLSPTATADVSKSDEQAALATGIDLEQQGKWTDAIRHYEKASRKLPDSRALYQRLIISRLNYDVQRRYADTSFVASVESLTPSEALDLYSEILANLETHYVEPTQWSRILLHGTAALEIALTNDVFIERLIATNPGLTRAAIEAFRLGIHQRVSERPTNTRFDLRSTVDHVAQLAQQELGLSQTAVALEYVGGAVSTLDQYTRLLSGDQLDEMFAGIEGNFVGLGIELKSGHDALQILSVIPGGPAEEAGIRAGEKIVRVESAYTDKSDPNVAADLLRGPENSMVSITVVNQTGIARELRVPRRRVEVPCVENVHIVDPESRIGYLRLTNFQKTTTRDVERALWDLHRQGMRSLVLDVRGNPGGLLSAAVEVADRFLDSGRIVTTRGRNSRENYDYVAHRPNTWSIPLAVLIDDQSASASEIFAGAIADSRRGNIVGQQSYGKGSVQGIFRMQSAKFGLCLTTAKFYSPNGTQISQNGVTPTVLVEPGENERSYIAARPDDNGNIISDADDLVLRRAIEVLAGNQVQISKRTR